MIQLLVNKRHPWPPAAPQLTTQQDGGNYEISNAATARSLTFQPVPVQTLFNVGNSRSSSLHRLMIEFAFYKCF